MTCLQRWLRHFNSISTNSSAGCPDVADRACHAWLLPEKFTGLGGHTALGLPGNTFDNLASADDDPDPRGLLGDGGSRLARLEHQAPTANAFIVEDLRVGRDLGTRAGGETARLRIHEGNDDIVEWSRPDVRNLVGHRLLGISGKTDVAARISPRRTRWFTPHLPHHVRIRHQHADLVERMRVITRHPTGRDVDIHQGHIFVAKHRHMKRRLLDRHGRPFDLRHCRRRERERANKDRCFEHGSA